jgi:ribonuclease E
MTLKSIAPFLIHEEGNLIKRAIRDIYARDIEEILVEGDDGYRMAKEFMRMLTPSHAKKVKCYKDAAIPLFHHFQIESQLDAMHNQTVTLRSGGSIVIGQTEALVAIDVNSGRATKERHIEETSRRRKKSPGNCAFAIWPALSLSILSIWKTAAIITR